MPSFIELSQRKSRLLTPRVLLLAFSLISLVICAWAAAAHYRKLAWGDRWQPIGWLLSMFVLLCAFLPASRGWSTGFRCCITPKQPSFFSGSSYRCGKHTQTQWVYLSGRVDSP